MTAPRLRQLDDRVVMLLATPRAAALTGDILARARIGSVACTGAQELDDAIRQGAGAVLISEEALSGGARGVLLRAVEHQLPWSDLPILVLTRSGADSPDVSDALHELGNVTLLERPLRLAALVSAVRTSLRARARQYQIREQMVQQERAREELAQIARRKDEFLAMLAHELRNPLAPIRNSLHLLGNNEGLDPAGSEKVRAMMERQVNHMVRLVDDLVDVSRISRGTIELRRQPVDLSEVVRNAVDASAPLVAAGRHELTVDLPQHPLVVDADPVRLAQVVGNLLNNAAKYSDPDGRIRLVARRDGSQAVIRVQDQGIGIEPAMLPQVFDLFTQGDRVQHRSRDGLGIGLTLVRTLVEMHGGSVVASSEGRGRGSEFEVRLPLAAIQEIPRATMPAASGRPDAAAETPLRVLVVDDNADAADSLGMVLQTLGVDSRIVYTGPDALRSLDEYEADAVLLDIGMPGMDGYEVARRIRSEGRHQPEMLVAVTGWGQPDDLRRSSAAGFDLHLNKPVDIDALKTLLDGLRRARAKAATRATPSA